MHVATKISKNLLVANRAFSLGTIRDKNVTAW